MYRREFLQSLAVAGLLLQGCKSQSHSEVVIAGEDLGVKDQLLRNRYPDQHYGDDIHIGEQQLPLLRTVQQRLERLQKTVGHGNFALLGVDEMRAYGRNYSAIGHFSKEEEALLEQLFYVDASSYGFHGTKTLGKLTDCIDRSALQRQSGSSQYLFKGEALSAYMKISRALGSEVELTSGVRGVVKQMHLFLSKTVAFGGNLSLASRSLAPPGYSFHGIGDFDVGQRGWAERNFSPEFASSDVFRRLQDLGYITMRYPEDNLLGVRYEPWHIKVVSA